MDSAQDGIAVMLHKCGVPEALIGRLRSDEAFTRRIAECIKLAAENSDFPGKPTIFTWYPSRGHVCYSDKRCCVP